MEPGNYLHGLVVPHKYSRLGSNLSCGAELSSGIDCHAMQVIVVLVEELLGVGLLVKHNAQCCSMVDYFASRCVTDVVPSIVASIAVDVLKLESALGSLGVSLVGLIG